ncbi:6840_t:CDS:2 [Entrophospora sp. SA101]|nr:6840_t:CDS:2 [Entrophospora sp. SA101]
MGKLKDVIAKGEDANTEGTKQEMHELKQDSIKLFETLHARNNNSQQSSSSSEEININYYSQLRPYIVKSTGTRPISEVKPLMAQSVLWLGTTWEYWVS